MERRFRIRLDELLDDAVVPPAVPRGMLPRVERFLEPFLADVGTSQQRAHARHYTAGLVSDLGRKNAEGIAYLHAQERQGLQKFLGQAAWEERPLLTELARQVGDQLGEPDGVLVLDPSGFPKKGGASVGVQRQWCGRLGKIDNCQVAVYLGYATRVEHALNDGYSRISRTSGATVHTERIPGKGKNRHGIDRSQGQRRLRSGGCLPRAGSSAAEPNERTGRHSRCGPVVLRSPHAPAALRVLR